MKLTKRQKMGVAVLVLGLGVLLVDRMFVLPQDAPGGQAAYSGQSSAQLIHEAPEVPASDDSAASSTIVQRLETLWSEKHLNLDDARDVFSLPAAWLAEVDPATGTVATSRAAFRFAQNHQLKAVIIDADQCSVFIDDDFLTIGQTLDGFTLVAATQDSATFEAGVERVVLRLQETDG
jgi:hypothetical protein